jgi:hypothetical protein
VVGFKNVYPDVALQIGEVAIKAAQQVKDGFERESGFGLILLRSRILSTRFYKSQRIRLQSQPITALYDQVQPRGMIGAFKPRNERAKTEFNLNLSERYSVVQQREPDSKSTRQKTGSRLDQSNLKPAAWREKYFSGEKNTFSGVKLRIELSVFDLLFKQPPAGQIYAEPGIEIRNTGSG